MYQITWTQNETIYTEVSQTLLGAGTVAEELLQSGISEVYIVRCPGE